MPSIRNDRHLRVLLNGAICKIPLFQRDPPLHKIRIPLPLPSAEPLGLLIGRAGDEYSYIIIGCKSGVMAVAALHDDQRRRAEGTRRQIGTFAAGVGLVGERLPCPGGSDDLIPQALDVHVGARNLLPACDSPGWREIEVVGVDGDALRKTLCQLCGQRRFAAAAAAIQCDEDGRLSGQTVGDGRGQLLG